MTDAVIATEDIADGHLVVRAEDRRTREHRLALVLNLADEAYAAGAVGIFLESSAPLVGGAVPPHGWAVFAD